MINQEEYKDKVLGCWLGKNIGGTVGAPYEWKRQTNEIAFYTQKNMNGEAMPNDDLDIQLLWLCALEERGVVINAQTLAEYWCTYVTPHWAEYGAAKLNMRSGILPPLSGWNANPFRHSCGSYIRSEIWACIAPGQPARAAEFAYEDAILDHGNGEGVYAEVFMATLESAAFLISDPRELIKIGLSYIPADCGVAAAVATTLQCIDDGMDWRQTRDEILRLHRGSADWLYVAPEDEAKGFRQSEKGAGYDVPSNIAITLAGLLYGGEDFGAVQCTCVNMGEDTDCTAATAGSVWGIIHGAQKIPQKWIDPIGRGIKTVCLNLGELGYFGNQLPKDVDVLTERTIRMARRVWLNWQPETPWLDFATLLRKPKTVAEDFRSKDSGRRLYECSRGPRFKFDFFTVSCDYIDGPMIRQGEPKKLRFTVLNLYKTHANLAMHWYLPDDWSVSPATDTWALLWSGMISNTLTFEFELTAECISKASNRAVLEFTCEGRPTVMLVPITLLSAPTAVCK